MSNVTATVTAADTPAAQAALAAFIARTTLARCDYCEDELDAGVCRRCEAEAEAEVYAEGAYLRAAENAQYVCYCGQGRPGICC